MSDGVLFEKYGITVRDGTVIFREGDVGDKMYIIQNGIVRIVKSMAGQDRQLAELSKGDFFGEMAIISRMRRTATAVSAGTVQLLAFDRNGFEAMIAKNSQVAMTVIDKLSRRLQHANAQIQRLVQLNGRSRIALNLLNRFMERGERDQTLTLNRTIEEISKSTELPLDLVTQVLYEFSDLGICGINTNALRLKNKQSLVALAEPGGAAME